MAYRVSYGDGMTPGMVNLGDQNTLEAETFGPLSLFTLLQVARFVLVITGRSTLCDYQR